MNTITAEQQAAIAAQLKDMILPAGLGSKESACSIAAINLALTGKLTDKIPHCMSEVIGKWIIPIQDAVPDEIRNSQRWKSLLPLAAGTGRDMERERLNIIMDWMWGTVLPSLQPTADRGGFGKEWLAMTTHRTEAAARAAKAAAAYAARVFAAEKAAGGAAWFAAGSAAYAAWFAAGSAAYAAVYAAGSAAYAAVYAAEKAAYAAVYAAEKAAEKAANAAGSAAKATAKAGTDAWTVFDPCDLLERLIRVGEQK